MLVHRADRRTLVCVAAYFGLVIAQWVWAPHSWILVIPLFAATCVGSFLGAVSTHNAVHCPIFKATWANRVFQVLLTLTYGYPVSAFVAGHNLSHHQYTQTPRDAMRTSKVRYRWNLLNLLLFMPTVGRDVSKHNLRYFKAMHRRHPLWFRQLLCEASALISVTLVLVIADWRKFLLYFFIPHLYGTFGIITMNMLQHDGTDAESAFNHSRNFISRTINWWTFNNGFHSIHHHKPGLHWSRLRTAHETEIAPHIHPALDQRSMVAYLWQTFVWPGRRLRYDGTALVLPPPQPDEESIPAPEDTPPQVSFGAVGFFKYSMANLSPARPETNLPSRSSRSPVGLLP